MTPPPPASSRTPPSRGRSLPVEDERALLAAARTGDDRAFAALVEPHRAMLHTVCYRITGDEHEAQDALQDALLAAWRNLDRFRGQARISTWLYRIAHNASLAVATRRVAEPVGDDLEERATTARGPAGTVADVHSVRWALARIPPDFRAALVLREYANLSYEEIARVQDLKVATVKTRIARARQAMARLLEIDDRGAP